MNVSSLKPEIGSELFKLVLLRESYLQRLAKTLNKSHGTVNIGLIDLLDVLRGMTIEVVDTIRMWERTQLNYPDVSPFTWNGINYLEKMMNDLEFVDQYHQITSWLGFSLSYNPFIVPQDVLTEETLYIKQGSFVVFGRKPDKFLNAEVKTVKQKTLKSPYITPIINDPEVYAHLSVKSQLNSKFKQQQKGRQTGSTSSLVDTDPYESYLSYETVEKIRNCWKALRRVNAISLGLQSQFVASTAVSDADMLRAEEDFHSEHYGEANVLSNNAFNTMNRDPLTSFADSTTQVNYNQSQPAVSQFNSSVLDGSHMMSTVVSSAEEEAFRRSKSQFQRTLQDSSGSNYQLIDASNIALRMSQVSARSTVGDSSGFQGSASSQIWTPHEINLQRQVQRRGGELFVLTAAGTKGRMKPPTRKTRFERMETDILLMNQQSVELAASLHDLMVQKDSALKATASIEEQAELLRDLESQIQTLGESKKDVELRKGFIQNQHQHFKMVAEGGALTDIVKQRKLHELLDGQALESDEKTSMSLEDLMACRIQRRVRQAFGRALRRAILLKRNKAAMVIQGMWRRAQVHMLSLTRGNQLRLAIMLQRLYRGQAVGETMRALKKEAEERRAAKNIQRLFRGYQGRKRLGLKRDFVRSLDEAYNAVSLRVLHPGELEELADAIERFVRDYTLDMPVAVLTVLRAILYMFNGDAAECVVVSVGGYTEKKYISASTATWHGVKLILRRKGRVLRRLRALIKNSRLPNPSSLKFTPDCVAHLAALVEGITVSDFDDLTEGRHCIVQMFHYCRHMKRAYDLQCLFPEYFDPGIPGWFRILLKLRGVFDRADLNRRVESKCKFRLEEHKRMYAREGRSWKPVGDAVKKNDAQLEEAKELRTKAKQKCTAYINQLKAGEQKRLKTLQGIERSRALGVEVAQGDLKEYLRSCFIPDEEVLKELHYNVDTKTISLLQTRSDVVLAEDANERNEVMRDFERHMKFKKLHEKCAELGAILADLMVLLNRWSTLIKSIGGFQYTKDLRGSRRELFEHIKEQALSLMKSRKEVSAAIEEELQLQYAKMIQLSYDAGMKAIAQYWDVPTHVEISAEDEENRECCRRDADFELRQKRQTAFVKIPNAPFHPVLVLVDARVPRNIRQTIVDTLVQYDYQLCPVSQSDPNLYNIFQASIDARKNIIFFANRGVHQIARLTFMTMFNSLLSGLIPRPHVVGVDCGRDLHIADWHSMFAADQQAMSQLDINKSLQCDLSLGKIRKVADRFRALLLHPSQNNNEGQCVPRWLRKCFLRDFRSFVDRITSLKFTTASDLSKLHIGVYSDIVLSSSIGCAFDFWKAPLTEWKDDDLVDGCKAFRKKCRELCYRELCDLLSLTSPLNTETIASRRLNQSKELTKAWRHMETFDFHRFPARNLLTEWILLVRDTLDWLSSQGGQAYSDYKNCEMKFVREVQWQRDVMHRADSANQTTLPGEELIGDLLYECLRPSMIYENEACPVKFYFDRANLESTETQSIGVAPTTQHVCVYQCDDETFVSVRVDNEKLKSVSEAGGRVHNWKFFSRMKIRDVISMLQPNNTEIFEGKVKKYDIRSVADGGTGKHKWYELLSNWACLDGIGEKFQITLLRARFLILSKIGQSNGYFIRLEIFEERFGEVRILIYGISANGGAVNYKVDRTAIYDLLNYCCIYEEKDKLEALDTQSIAYIFSDRLEVRPSKGWRHFLDNGELIPKAMNKETNVKLRKKRGPGRFVGRRIVKVSTLSLVVTIYEIDNETSSHELRVVLYEQAQCQTAEYRISPMERLMLFSDDVPLLEQICSRIRHVYCDLSEKSRRLILLDDSIKPKFTFFEVEGDDEYDICSVISEADDETIGESTSHAQSKSVAESESYYDDDDDDDESLDSSQRRRKRRKSRFARRNSNDSNSVIAKHKIKSNWGWAVYFHRSVVSESKGNLIVSVGLNVSLNGFTVIVFDQRTFREAYRMLTYEEVCALQDKPIDELREELSNLDESVAFDLMDELLSLVEVQDSDDEGLAIVLCSGEGDEDRDRTEDMIVARLKEHKHFVPCTMSRKKQGVPIQDVEITVYGAKELARLGTFGMRNALALIKWNMREIGRTPVIRSTLNPVWEEGNKFRATTVRDQQIKDCSIDIEIWDTDGKTTLTEFLGCVRYVGISLVKFLDGASGKGGNNQWTELGKSKRLSDAENRCVKGAIEISGHRRNLINQFTQSDKDDDVSKSDQASVSVMSSISRHFGVTAAPLSPVVPADTTAPPSEGNKAKVVPASSFFGRASTKFLSTAFFTPSPVVNQVPAESETAPIVPEKPPLIGLLRGLSTKNTVDKAPSSFVRAQPRSTEHSTRDTTKPPQLWERSALSFKMSAPLEDDEADADIPIPTSSLTPSVNFNLSVITAKGFPASTNVTCVIKLNGVEVTRIQSASSDSVGDDSKVSVEFTEPPLVVTCPAGFPIGGCCLSLSLYLGDSKEACGSIDIRGSALRAFVQQQAAYNPVWFDLCSPKTGSVDRTLGRLLLYASIVPILQRKLTVNILGAQNVTKADTFGKSDPYVKVFFNDKLMGRTRTIKNTLNPDWGITETHTLLIPVGRDLTACKLEVEIYDHDSMSADDFLGTRIIEGADLVALMTSPPYSTDTMTSADVKVTKRGLAFPLQKSIKTSVEHSLAINGDIELCGAIDVATEKAISTQQLLPVTTSTANDESVSLLEYVQNDVSLQIALNIHSAIGLAKADTFGKSDPFVIVIFNGIVIGQTRCIKNTLDPVWGEDEVFMLEVPRGQTLDTCRLQLEVFDADNLTQGDFLGCVFYSGHELLNEIQKFIGGASSATHYSLQPSLSRTEKENAIVKGDLDVRFSFSTGIGSSVARLRELVLKYERVHCVELGIISVDELLASITDSHMRTSNAVLSVKIDWNGQTICHLPAKWLYANNSVIFDDLNFFTICLPASTTEYSLENCLLQLYVCASDDKVISTTAVSGTLLTQVCEATGENGTLLSMMPPVSLPQKSSKTSIRVRCLLADEASVHFEHDPGVDYESRDNRMRGPVENSVYPLLATSLNEDQEQWRHYFPHTLDCLPYDRMAFQPETEVTAEVPVSSPQSKANGATKRITSHLQKAVIETVMADSKQVESETATGLVAATTKVKTQKMQLELAALNFTVTTREIVDDHRTCWRGRVMPKNFIAPDEAAKKAIMLTRSSRLIRMKNIRDMQVMAEIHYLADTVDEDAETSDQLPICVKEIITDGPGLAKRVYRVEVSANNGILMGTADIRDEEVDFRRLVGQNGPSELLNGSKKTWKLGPIFEYISRERLILDMMPAGHRKQGAAKDGRRDGVMAAGGHHEHPQHAVDNMDVSGSLITLIRDPLPVDTASPSADDHLIIPTGFVAEDTNQPHPSPVHIDSVNGSVVDLESMIATDKTVYSDDSNMKMNWLRIHTRTHRLTGKTFLTLVLLQSTNRIFADSVDYYFKTYKPEQCLASMNVLFRCKDSWTKIIHDLIIPGTEILDWLPKSFEIDLKTKFRRDKFGAYLVQYLSLRYDQNGDFAIYLVQEDRSDEHQTDLSELVQEAKEVAAVDSGGTAEMATTSGSGKLGNFKDSTSRRNSRVAAATLRRSSISSNMSGIVPDADAAANGGDIISRVRTRTASEFSADLSGDNGAQFGRANSKRRQSFSEFLGVHEHA